MSKSPVQLEFKEEEKNINTVIDAIKKKRKKAPKTVLTKRQMTNLEKNLMIISEKLKEISLGDMRVLTKTEDVNRYIDKIYETGEVAVDIETSGLRIYEDEIAGICLYTPNSFPVYIPFGHIDINGYLQSNQCKIDETRMKEMLEDKEIFHIGHNYKFDAKFLISQLGYKAKVDWDTMIAAHILNENERKGLNTLWAKYLNNGQESSGYSTLFNKVDFRLTNPHESVKYAAFDAKMTYDLYNFQQQHLNPHGHLKDQYKLFKEVEMPLSGFFTEEELYGVRINVEESHKLAKKYQEEIDKLESDVWDYIKTLDLDKLSQETRDKLGDPVNINSSLQLSIIIYDVIRLTNEIKGKERSTDQQSMAFLKDKYKNRHDLVKIIDYVLEYKQLKKLLGSYAEKLPNEVSEATERIHHTNNQVGTVTGRISMSNPNFQQIPSGVKEIRQLFIPTEDYLIVSADFSQQEPRILAYVSQDENLIKTFKEDKDIYSQVSAMVFNETYENSLEFYSDGTVNEKATERRGVIKNIILGKVYGRGISSIAEALKITEKEAQKISDDFDKRFPNVQQTIDRLTAFAKVYGYVETVYNRKRRLPEIQLDPNIRQNTYKISRASRQVLNSVIQGTAGDILKKVVICLHEDKEFNELGGRVLFSVHDEILAEFPIGNEIQGAKALRRVMIDVPKDKIDVPMKVDLTISDKWFGHNLIEDIKGGI